MTDTASWVVAIGVLLWCRDLSAADRAFWASVVVYGAWFLPLAALALVLADRVRFAWVPTLFGIALVCSLGLQFAPDNFRGLPVHSLAVATVLFFALRLTADALGLIADGTPGAAAPPRPELLDGDRRP